MRPFESLGLGATRASMNLGVDPNLSKSLPAPHIFAPSREDVLSTLAFFFGEPSVPEKLRDYSEHNAMTCALPIRTPHTTHAPRIDEANGHVLLQDV